MSKSIENRAKEYARTDIKRIHLKLVLENTTDLQVIDALKDIRYRAYLAGYNRKSNETTNGDTD